MKKFRALLPFILACIGCFISIYLLTASTLIATAFALLALAFTYVFVNSRKGKVESEIAASWPEVIDHLTSGIQSGMSLTEALTELSSRGPIVMRPAFTQFKIQIFEDGDFDRGIRILAEKFGSHAGDQIFQALLISKTLGGSELLSILRTLGNFLRQDLALRNEIAVKQSWIKNSAHLSSAAPWLLLLLLAMQPSTVTAFSTPSGAGILFLGLSLTVIAYIWMTHLSKLPTVPRVFGNPT
ncbi:MAG: type II secretion system F family protein [Candidatus Planktophila sp.]